MAKPGFMMYHGECRALGALNDASFRRVIEGMLKYSETGEEPELKDTTERVVFGLMRTRLDEDEARYQSRIEAGRKGGVASGEARRSKTKQREVCFNQTKQDEAMRSMLQPNEANEPIQYNSNTIQPQYNSNTGNSSNSYAREEEEFPPTVEMVEEYVREKGLNVDAQEFIDRCEANGWLDGKGRPVINWRTWLTGYALRAIRPEEGGAARLRPDPRLAAFEAMKGGTA